MGTRRLVDKLAKKAGLKTTVPYSAWFVDKQVNNIVLVGLFDMNRFAHILLCF